LALLEQLLRGIEDVQAGSAAHGAMGGAELDEIDAKAGAAMGALGDETFGHATIRRPAIRETTRLV
jgi:hypothetical protein